MKLFEKTHTHRAYDLRLATGFRCDPKARATEGAVRALGFLGGKSWHISKAHVSRERIPPTGEKTPVLTPQGRVSRCAEPPATQQEKAKQPN